MYTEQAAVSVRHDHGTCALDGSDGLAGLFRRQSVERFDPGEAVFWEGDAATHVFQIVEGVLRAYRIIGGGRRVITDFLKCGDFLGLSLRERTATTTEAVTRVRLRRLPRVRFDEDVNASSDLRLEVHTRLCDEMAAAQDQMVLLARKNAEERVASFLVMLAHRLAGEGACHGVVNVPMTRLDMADYLGLTIETVSRIMTRLAARGLIAPLGRHAIRMMQPAKLEALAGEDGEEDHRAMRMFGTEQAVWPN